jgi:predicted secreted Zn-dependent protease
VRRLRLAALAACIVAVPALAQVHMCKGADGRKVFSDVPCGDDSKVIDVRPSGGGMAVNPSTSLRIEYYDIRGATYAELEREIARKGPEGRWWGDAATPIGFEVTSKRAPEGCAIGTARVFADSTVRLPRWANRHDGDRRTQEQWDSAFRTLDLHERGHVQISLDTARDLERALREIPPAATCDAVIAEAKARAQALNARERQRQASYDRDTNHGVSQWSPYK